MRRNLLSSQSMHSVSTFSSQNVKFPMPWLMSLIQKMRNDTDFIPLISGFFPKADGTSSLWQSKQGAKLTYLHFKERTAFQELLNITDAISFIFRLQAVLKKDNPLSSVHYLLSRLYSGGPAWILTCAVYTELRKLLEGAAGGGRQAVEAGRASH